MFLPSYISQRILNLNASDLLMAAVSFSHMNHYNCRCSSFPALSNSLIMSSPTSTTSINLSKLDPSIKTFKGECSLDIESHLFLFLWFSPGGGAPNSVAQGDIWLVTHCLNGRSTIACTLCVINGGRKLLCVSQVNLTRSRLRVRQACRRMKQKFIRNTQKSPRHTSLILSQ